MFFASLYFGTLHISCPCLVPWLKQFHRLTVKSKRLHTKLFFTLLAIGTWATITSLLLHINSGLPSWSELRLTAVRQIHAEVPFLEFPYQKEKQIINIILNSRKANWRAPDSSGMCKQPHQMLGIPWWEGIQWQNQSPTLSSLPARSVFFRTVQEPWETGKGIWCYNRPSVQVFLQGDRRLRQTPNKMNRLGEAKVGSKGQKNPWKVGSKGTCPSSFPSPDLLFFLLSPIWIFS